MKKSNKISNLLILIGIILYGLSIFTMSEFAKQDQVNHLVALKDDYLLFTKDNNQQALATWANNHQLQIIPDTAPNDANLKKFTQKLVREQKIDDNLPICVANYHHQKYLFCLLDNSKSSTTKILVKKYRSLWSIANWLILFTLIFVLIWLAIIVLQRMQMRQEDSRWQTIRQHLQHLLADANIQEPNQLAGALSSKINQLTTDNFLAKRQFKSLMKHLPVGVMLLDHNGNVILHNQAIAVILEQNISDEPHYFGQDIKTRQLQKMILHTLKQNRNHHQEIKLANKSQRFVDANVIRITHTVEKVQRQVIVILYDLTEFRQIEQEQINFVGNVSHELKTPVTSIIGFTDTLLNGAKNEPQQCTKFLQIIKQESLRLINLIEDSLALTKIDQHSITLTRINLRELLQHILTEYQHAIKQANLTVTYNIQGNPWISSGQNTLSQIIHNLISNAIKYNQSQGKIIINLKHDEIDNYLTINVSDTGIGISSEAQKHIFERFYRADKSRNQKIPGTGLGLAIVKQAVQSLNGKITVTSNLGTGSTFEVIIPL